MRSDRRWFLSALASLPFLGPLLAKTEIPAERFIGELNGFKSYEIVGKGLIITRHAQIRPNLFTTAAHDALEAFDKMGGPVPILKPLPDIRYDGATAFGFFGFK